MYSYFFQKLLARSETISSSGGHALLVTQVASYAKVKSQSHKPSF